VWAGIVYIRTRYFKLTRAGLRLQPIKRTLIDEFADRWSAAQVRAEVDRLIESFESNPDGAEYFAGNAPSTEMKREWLDLALPKNHDDALSRPDAAYWVIAMERDPRALELV
jgi:hypothetical protein